MQVKSMGVFAMPRTGFGFHRDGFHPPPYLSSMSMPFQMPQLPQIMMGGAAVMDPNLSSNLARQARRLYIGNLPSNTNETEFLDFFNQTLVSAGITSGSGNPIVSHQVNPEKGFAFVEFRTTEEATKGLALDNITYMGTTLRIKRPKDYVGGPVPLDSPNKIIVTGLPLFFNDEQVKELFSAFGELKSFTLVKDPETEESKGTAYCEYVDPTLTDLAVENLNGLDIGDSKIAVSRITAASGSSFMNFVGGGTEATHVLQLLNMVTEGELFNDEEYEDICEDVKEECGKFGKVASIKIPRPNPEYKVPGVGKIFVEFESIDGCSIAFRALAGRKFAARTVVTSYFSEEKYANSEFE